MTIRRKISQSAAIALTAVALAACGTQPNPVAPHGKTPVTSAAKKSKRLAPPAPKQHRMRQGLTDSVVGEAQTIGAKTFDAYGVLYEAWQKATTDADKDAIDTKMVATLAHGMASIDRLMKGSTNNSASAQKVRSLASEAMMTYGEIDVRLKASTSLNEKRYLTHQQMDTLFKALDAIMTTTP